MGAFTYSTTRTDPLSEAFYEAYIANQRAQGIANPPATWVPYAEKPASPPPDYFAITRGLV